MMRITIAQRCHPFSHQIGTKMLLPKSSLVVQVFPTRIFFCDLNHQMRNFFVSLAFIGPVSGFTVELDLERGLLCVFGQTQRGYMRFLLQAEKEGVLLSMEKIPEQKVECTYSFAPHSFFLEKSSQFLIPLPWITEVVTSEERLSLGMHKSQDWDGIRRRLDFKEILPIWHRLSRWVLPTEARPHGGNVQLLDLCAEKISNRDRVKVLDAFEAFFLAAFEGVLVPRLVDTEYQGFFTHEPMSLSESPLFLLTQGGKVIRSLFFQETESAIALLPCLPPSFHCGRMTSVRSSEGHLLDFEWTKKTLRRLRLNCTKEGVVSLKLPKKVSSYRIKVGRKTIQSPPLDAEGKIHLELRAKELVHFDRFQ